jgi:hypothetical protein
MEQSTKKKTTGRGALRGVVVLATVGLTGALAACSADDGSGTLGGGNGGGTGDPIPIGTATGTPSGGGSNGGTTGQGSGGDPNVGNNPNIAQRMINYGEALRTASLKLVGSLPALADIDAIQAATGPAAKTLYESKIDALLADPRFATMQIIWWRNTLKTGQQGQVQQGMPSLDTAALFAASVVVGDRPYTDLFTATTMTCPTFANGVFTPAACTTTAPTAGLLTDPGLMAQYFSNMAFRRVRFVQETFVCNKFPAEYSKTPTPMGSSIYTSPWSFNSIAGGATARINFQDTSAVICANCHTTMNHIAPLFGHFDAKGAYDPMAIQVMTPITPPATTMMTDWLPTGQQTLAWRDGTAITDLPSLGAAMAADPDIARCAVNRVWDWAFSRGDIVNDLATIPAVVTDDLTKSFTTNGMKLKSVIRAVYTSDDFVRF